ncbi:MAG: UDP-3-O-(3-hydroxymyristoyl)glucosamine N-acyltransferase [Holosporaceae bacterium]|jgi:UDP-3-O-[3-hydroxymyristoyl] glucosamine N-acyltransferase|nr:UDP-3-O-(3-hydroxymyristoyl)glucosamine N-acyltransferase [Holosporaceae bacterium]
MIDRTFWKEPRKIMASELATMCGFVKVGDGDFTISDVATLERATASELSFFGNRKYIQNLRNTKAGAVIVTEANLKDLPAGAIGLVFTNATVGYALAVDLLYRDSNSTHLHHICDTARIHKTAKIGSNCHIGHNVFLGENVEIGDNVYIGRNTVIEDNCKIGSGGCIRNNVIISHSIIGKNVRINSGAIIGESGFGILPTGSSMIYVKQLGRVIIGDRVRIGANTCIDRGSLDDTVVDDDTIIDNLVQIAHNVKIGKRSILVSQVGIAGSTEIGNDVVLAGQVGVAGHIRIGDKAVAAAKSGIAASIEPGQVVGGIPALDADLWKRQVVFLKRAVTKKKHET